MEPAVVIAIIGVLAAPIAAVVTWLLNRKKHISDIYSALAESSQSAVETMQMTMTTLHNELKEAKERIEDLISENELLRKDLAELMIENRELKDKIDKLSRQMTEFKNQE
jgi:predicted RNase H-like nuclease (RuvC/YqgF family)